MVKNKIVRASALVAASLGLMANAAGVAGASSSSGVIDTTGFNSLNTVKNIDSLRARSSLKVANHDNTLVGNSTSQDAYSGRARASENTTSGDVFSGDTSNHSSTSTALDIRNSTPSLAHPDLSLPSLGGGSGQIGTTGADSSNVVVNKQKVDLSSKVTIANDVNTAVLNNTDQHASSGSAEADRNTKVGTVESGNSSNVSSTSTTINVSN